MTTAYGLTEAGTRALESERSVPAWYRTILGLIHGETTSSEIHRSIGSHPPKQVLNWIAELETLGFVEVVASDPSAQPAEATGDFGFDLLLAEQKRAA